jgi:cytoskeletal protein CcmA (bactofilin family)
MRPAITLTGRIGGLVLDQGTVLTGSVALHHGSLKRGKSRSFVPGADAWTILRESPPLPVDIKPLADYMKTCSERLKTAGHDTGGVRTSLTLTSQNDTLLRRSPLVVDGDCEFGVVNAHGVSLVVTGTVRLREGASLTDVEVVAKRLVVEGGNTHHCLFYTDSTQEVLAGTHASQFISLDSIAVGRDAHFGPATLWIARRHLRPDTTLAGCISFGAGGTYVGHALCYIDSADSNARNLEKPAIELGEGSTLTGSIVTDGVAQLKNVTIHGHIWASSTVCLEGNMPYKNWLFGCTVDTSGAKVPFPLLGKPPLAVEVAR